MRRFATCLVKSLGCFAAALAVLSVSACGGGGSSSTASGDSGGGDGSTVTSSSISLPTSVQVVSAN